MSQPAHGASWSPGLMQKPHTRRQSSEQARAGGGLRAGRAFFSLSLFPHALLSLLLHSSSVRRHGREERSKPPIVGSSRKSGYSSALCDRMSQIFSTRPVEGAAHATNSVSLSTSLRGTLRAMDRRVSSYCHHHTSEQSVRRPRLLSLASTTANWKRCVGTP